MMSFYYVFTPTCGNWFQTNQPEHESNDPTDDTVTSVCYQWERYSISVAIFDQHLSLYCGAVKPKLQKGPYCFLWDMILKIYWQFWYSFFKTAVVSSNNFYPIEITWRKMVHSVCLIPVSMIMWCLLTSWRFTLAVYELHKAMNFNFVQVFMQCTNCINTWMKLKCMALCIKCVYSCILWIVLCIQYVILYVECIFQPFWLAVINLRLPKRGGYPGGYSHIWPNGDVPL